MGWEVENKNRRSAEALFGTFADFETLLKSVGRLLCIRVAPLVIQIKTGCILMFRANSVKAKCRRENNNNKKKNH